jgi:hypothetical protein
MTGGLFGLLVFAFLAAAALFSLWLHPRLPELYRSAETTSNLRLGMGVIATITAVVLGLLISSVKGSFDLASRDVQALAADLIVLDRTLHFYGPNAAHARDLLARYTERVLEGTWPSGGQAATVDDQVADDLLNQTEQAILSRQPDPQESDLGGPPRASACGLGTFVGAVLEGTMELTSETTAEFLRHGRRK